MNQVTIQATITRATPQSCEIDISRIGSGDDMVEQHADEFERILTSVADQLVRLGAGRYLAPPSKGEEQPT